MTYIDALQLIATPQRHDGTWSHDREACRQIAAEALGWHNTGEAPSVEPVAQGVGTPEFESWWSHHGQFIRAGGGDYEKCFAFSAWCAATPQAQPAALADDARDAARYRWLRRWKGQEHEPPFTVQHELDGTLWCGDLDAAIDAAAGVTPQEGANG